MSQHDDLYGILKRPLITEKSTALTQGNQYVFEVVRDANKIQIAKAVELAFPGRKVTKVRTIHIPALTKRFGKKIGTRQATKKAIVSIVGEPLEQFIGV
jgi:large subunit ribosomal protein L23